MKIGILRVGEVDSEVVDRVIENLRIAFPKSKCTLIREILSVPSEAYDKVRGQHRSDIILRQIRTHVEKVKVFDRVLGMTSVDLFVPELNFVFGEAECPGRAALISLFRLKPEFYGEKPNVALLVERATKEAVHELGHTFGLAHCSNPFCVMYFSNSIFETDRKQSLFCNKCQMKIGLTL
ncbi:MAG: archaemetzincin family Zn-dependent metalloprotease [Candidatus Bathyarchaeia archaeon]